jgi:hypothetical protein
MAPGGKAVLLFAVFGLVGSLLAADRMGTWKLNIAKSKLPPSAANLKKSRIKKQSAPEGAKGNINGERARE